MPNEHPALYSVDEVDRKLCSHFCKHLQDVKFNLEDAKKFENHFNLPDGSSDNTAFSKKKRNTGSRENNGTESKMPSLALGIGEFHKRYF